MITSIYETPIRVSHNFLAPMTHLLDFNAIISQLDLRIINSYAILILGGIAVFSFILSPNLARLMLYTFSHSVLNVVQKFLQQKGFLLDSPTASSSKSYFNNDPTVSSKFRILIRHLPCELKDVSLENIQNSLRLVYEKFTSKVPLRRFFVKAKNAVVDNSQQQPVSCFVDSEIIRNRNTTACSTDSWKHSPRIWTWPWLGSLCSYTRDPLGFIQKHHQSKVSQSDALSKRKFFIIFPLSRWSFFLLRQYNRS
jgi:hypothetical protein